MAEKKRSSKNRWDAKELVGTLATYGEGRGRSKIEVGQVGGPLLKKAGRKSTGGVGKFLRRKKKKNSVNTWPRGAGRKKRIKTDRGGTRTAPGGGRRKPTEFSQEDRNVCPLATCKNA